MADTQPTQTAAPAAAPAQAGPQQRGGQQNRQGGRPGGNNRRPARDQAPEEKLFDERIVNIDRVARVVKGGRRFRFRALAVVGDRKNKIGIGSAKGADVTSAVAKAMDVAKKNMITVHLYKDTLPHESSAKVGGANILIKPAAPGTGLIAGGVVRTVLEVAGVKNALSKSLGSTNKTNTAYATLAAMQSIQPAKNWVTKSAVAKSEAKKAAKAVPAPAKAAEKTEAK
ncbi:30S ribosomal protein S5 [Candidatus Saccharibacteria bacterium]|nr:MAG: 30S ribosomal protein S5 [Candidatus Saccharibacteria bacterium]